MRELSKRVGRGLLVLSALATGCSAAHSPCGERGRYVQGDAQDYCVYALTQPIVIEGGFNCPVDMQFQADLDGKRVCSDQPVDPAHVPDGVCAQGACSEELPRAPSAMHVQPAAQPTVVQQPA